MEKNICKHCGKEMNRVAMPFDSDWGVEYLIVCLNDECSYYKRGWEWMQQNYNVTSSYRYRIDPTNGSDGPIPVTNPMYLRDLVIE
jgi:hypothetical protein